MFKNIFNFKLEDFSMGKWAQKCSNSVFVVVVVEWNRKDWHGICGYCKFMFCLLCDIWIEKMFWRFHIIMFHFECGFVCLHRINATYYGHNQSAIILVGFFFFSPLKFSWLQSNWNENHFSIIHIEMNVLIDGWWWILNFEYTLK